MDVNMKPVNLAQPLYFNQVHVQNPGRIKFGQGTYYIGDPLNLIYDHTDPNCTLRDEIDQAMYDYRLHSVYFMLGPRQVYMHNTAHEVGTFIDNDDFVYETYNGLLCISTIPNSLSYPNLSTEMHLVGHGRIIHMPHPFYAYVEDGVFHVGDIKIVTE